MKGVKGVSVGFDNGIYMGIEKKVGTISAIIFFGDNYIVVLPFEIQILILQVTAYKIGALSLFP